MRSRTVEKYYLIDQPSKRLRRAFRATYFVVSLSNSALLRRRAAEDRILPVSDLDNDDGRPFCVTLDIFTEVDRKALSVLVPERKMDALAKFGGGVNSLAAALQSDPKLGISGEDVKRRIELFGSNTYVKPPVRSFFSFVVEAFKDITILILLACAVLSLGFGIKQHGIKEGWYDGGSIIVAVILVVAVSAVSNYRQGTQFHKLSVESEDIKVQVLRDGRRQAISVFEVVVGDVLFLSIGDRVPADGLFLDGYSMKVDESSMNGESDHVAVESATNPFLLSGTKVVDGYGHMIVTSVGMNTSWGEMMSSINRDSNELTPLQERLTKLTSYIGKIGLLVAFVVLAVLLIRYFTGHTEDDQGRREFTKGQTKADDVMNAMIRIVAAAVTIIVVAIPEGLPLAVTLTLAYSMRKMMGDNAMVRKLSACETMGSATTICTDKTGTLTLNQMKVTEAWIGKTALLSTDSCSPEVLQKLQEGIAMNTTGEVFQRKEISGSPTESAILHWAVFDLDADIEELKKRHEMVHVEAFNSKKKRSGVLIRKTGSCRQGNGTVEAHWKGAAEMILGMCSNYYDQDGMMMPMTNEDRMQIEGIIDDMAAKSLRCIAFAHKEIGRVTEEIEETGLTLLSIVGIKDPCRPGVREAVMSCKHAGVDVKMITGDNKFTATAIALECGILRASEDLTQAVVEGVVFRNYTNEERMEKIDMIRVMARSSPIDKLVMVECLKRKGHVVAVTGDGTNDAPALKEADIGLSMGIQGTEVAKESSDIVIMDDNFSSVVTVLKWGRCVYNNIQKFIQFQLTVNVAALVINVVAALSSGEVPLTAVQLLWVNLIMDTLGALALATEQPRNDLLQKKPVGRREALITRVMWRNLMAQAVYQITVLLVLEFKGREIFGVGEKVKDTLVFNSFVLCQVFNEFNARSLVKKNIFVGILKNRLFIGIIVVTLVLQALMVEFLKKFASTERLNWGQWGVCILIGSLSWPIAWVVKLIPVSRKRHLLSLPTTTNSTNTME